MVERLEFHHGQSTANSGFSSLAFDDSMITTMSRQVNTLNSSTTYYWRVNARNSSGTSGWSGTWSFVTASSPQAPTLASPVEGATGQSTTPTLNWNTSTGATSYALQVSLYANFSSVIVGTYVTGNTSQSVGPLNGTTIYYWRVSATNNIGTSPWSSSRSFTTGPAPVPTAPTLLFPSNGSSAQHTALTIQWYGSTYATSYQLQVSTNPGFGSFIVNQSGVGSTSLYVSDLSYSTTYYWRVKAANSSGTSSWSSTWGFTTEAGAPDPCLELASATSATVDQITLSDAHGNRQNLFVRNGARASGPHTDEMPPDPPPGLFNVRFQSGKMTETVPTGEPARKIPILIRDAAFPITLQWNVHAQNAVTYYLVSHDKGRNEILLADTGSIVLSDEGHGALLLEASSSTPCDPARAGLSANGRKETSTKPDAYVLQQNVPNPFNPATTFHYELPEASHVALKIYNVLGQEVITLIDGTQSAGVFNATWNASDKPSGIYFVRMTALDGNSRQVYQEVKKVVLMK